MSTNDVPGANPVNADVLAMGCWAEHEDGSLIFVESTEGNRVVYSMFDMSKDPIIEYRDAMPEVSFKKTFSWEPDSKKAKKKSTNEKWTWHDKTPFNWDRVIPHGAQDGTRLASAAAIMTAAERVAASLKLHGGRISEELKYRADETVSASVSLSGAIFDKIKRAVNELRK